MEEVLDEYHVVVFGTGLTECVLSGLSSIKGKKDDNRVLHIDRNDHYGGEAASVNLEDLFKMHPDVLGKREEPWKEYYKPIAGAQKNIRPGDWNIDLVPKLLMSNGELVNILAELEVNKYVTFKLIGGSFVQQNSGTRATVAKVPSTAAEALKSPLMGLFEKRRAKNFLQWVGDFKEGDPKTHQGMNLMQTTMKQVYEKFGLEATTRDFIGHSMALYSTDEYIDKRGMTKDCIERIRLYVNSMARYGKSPFIYPEYGLGELPQGFARLSAVHGGTYMLNTTINDIKYGPDGKVTAVKATMKDRDGEEMTFETKCKKIIADPTYFPDKVRVVGHLLRAICILKHPIDKTDSSDSLQLIIPQSQVGRKNDIYISVLSKAQEVCPEGYYVATVSTIAETKADHILELKPGLDRLGQIAELFMGSPIPIYAPLDDGTKDNIFISKSYDHTSHFETTTDDIRDIWRRAEGEELKVEGLKPGQSLTDDD